MLFDRAPFRAPSTTIARYYENIKTSITSTVIINNNAYTDYRMLLVYNFACVSHSTKTRVLQLRKNAQFHVYDNCKTITIFYNHVTVRAQTQY